MHDLIWFFLFKANYIFKLVSFYCDASQKIEALQKEILENKKITEALRWNLFERDERIEYLENLDRTSCPRFGGYISPVTGVPLLKTQIGNNLFSWDRSCQNNLFSWDMKLSK